VAVVLASHAREEEAIALAERVVRDEWVAAGRPAPVLVRAVPAEGEGDALDQYRYQTDGMPELSVDPAREGAGGG
jgi:hypothetical protein